MPCAVKTVCKRIRVGVVILFCAAIAVGQSTSAGSDADVAAAAKLARQQREIEKARRSERSEIVSDMAKELSEVDEGAIPGAPAGYRYYYFKPGDYAILVPADAKPEARDRYGLRLFSEEAFTSRIEVILGEPILAPGKTAEEMIHNANADYFSGCGLNLNGLGPAVNGHAAHSAGFSGCPLHREVLGYAEFVVSDAYVMPVVCGYPMTAQDLDPSPNQPIQRITKKYDRERRGFEVCALIQGSLKFHPYAGRWKPKIVPGESQPKVTSALSTQKTRTDEVMAEMSLGELARAHKKSASGKVLTDLRHSSAGYTSLTFRYSCTSDNSVCYSASLEMPIQAQQNNQFVRSYTGLFQFALPLEGGKFAIFQANTGASTEPGILSREEFIRTKVGWWIGYSPATYYSAVGQGQVLSEELTEIGGVPARLATFRNTSGSGPVITRLAAYMVPGKFLQIRCSASEESSGEAQAMCEHVLQSLEIPKSEKQELEPDDPPAEQATRDDSDSE